MLWNSLLLGLRSIRRHLLRSFLTLWASSLASVRW
jgi:hypothetical protein